MYMYNFISLSNVPLFTCLLPNSNISSLVKSCPFYNWNVYFLFVELRESFTCSEYKTFVRFGFASLFILFFRVSGSAMFRNRIFKRFWKSYSERFPR